MPEPHYDEDCYLEERYGEEEMSMTEWAEEEVKIACKKENPNWDGESFDYGCSCYQSALKAYKSLCEDGHSGYSFAVTRNILERLMNSLPLSPIEDIPENWNCITGFYGDTKKQEYQCIRKSSLFKHIDEYGRITFSDNDRIISYELGDEHGFHSGLVSRIVNEMYPIKFPYMPSKNPYKVYCENFLSDEQNGDFDMYAIFYLFTPDGNKVEINRYFDLRSDEAKEISKDEYFYIKEHKVINNENTKIL